VVLIIIKIIIEGLYNTLLLSNKEDIDNILYLYREDKNGLISI